MEKRYKNIFVLGTGRNGSTSFACACKHIENYSAGHETRLGMLAKNKIQYPDYHIESDNRLSWVLGVLAERFRSDVFYVHLRRSGDLVADSYNQRWHIANGIMPAYSQGILNIPISGNDIDVCRDYVEVVNSNISDFLRDKPMMTIDVESFDKDFHEFWNRIGAVGDYERARQGFYETANAGRSPARFRRAVYSVKRFQGRLIDILLRPIGKRRL